MRDSALKPVDPVAFEQLPAKVGEELMRDSALKLGQGDHLKRSVLRRRRAHARQRFETNGRSLTRSYSAMTSEKSSCATAL